MSFIHDLVEFIVVDAQCQDCALSKWRTQTWVPFSTVGFVLFLQPGLGQFDFIKCDGRPLRLGAVVRPLSTTVRAANACHVLNNANQSALLVQLCLWTGFDASPGDTILGELSAVVTAHAASLQFPIDGVFAQSLAP